jgi:hypothetical protein
MSPLMLFYICLRIFHLYRKTLTVYEMYIGLCSAHDLGEGRTHYRVIPLVTNTSIVLVFFEGPSTWSTRVQETRSTKMICSKADGVK